MARKNVALEERGVPTVGIVYRNFADDYKSSARAVGMEHAPRVVVDYAYTGLSPEAVRADVGKHVDEVIGALTTPLRRVESATVREKIVTQAGYAAPWGTVEAGPIDQELVRFTDRDYSQAYDEFQQKFLDWGWGDGFRLYSDYRPFLLSQELCL